jgi:hypothetical protein
MNTERGIEGRGRFLPADVNIFRVSTDISKVRKVQNQTKTLSRTIVCKALAWRPPGYHVFRGSAGENIRARSRDNNIQLRNT